MNTENEQPQSATTAEVESSAMLAKYKAALERIAECVGAPDISPNGDIELGLHCGVEDRMCSDRYEGANVGYENGAEAVMEWAVNEAKHALSISG